MARNGKLLTLDLSTNLGWSCGYPLDKAFASGSYRLPQTGDDVGAYLVAYEEWLTSALLCVSETVFEAPILPRMTSLATARKLYGLCGETQKTCRRLGIECSEVNNMTVKAFLGSGRLDKAGIMRAIRAYGYPVASHDEADAIGIRLFVLHRDYPTAAARFHMDMGPLGAVAAC